MATVKNCETDEENNNKLLNTKFRRKKYIRFLCVLLSVVYDITIRNFYFVKIFDRTTHNLKMFFLSQRENGNFVLGVYPDLYVRIVLQNNTVFPKGENTEGFNPHYSILIFLC